MLSPVISIVLNFSDKKWNTSKCLKDMIEIPEELLIYSDFIQDYKMLVFDIAFLEDDIISEFKSDFGIVVRFFKNKRTNNLNDMSVADVKRVKPLLRFFSEMTNQKEFENLEDRLLAEKMKGVRIPMCTFTQGLVDEGIAKEKKATIIRMLKINRPLEEIGIVADVSLSTIQKIKKQLASDTDDESAKINNF